jgi:iron complex transport system substrate-binding protein
MGRWLVSFFHCFLGADKRGANQLQNEFRSEVSFIRYTYKHITAILCVLPLVILLAANSAAASAKPLVHHRHQVVGSDGVSALVADMAHFGLIKQAPAKKKSFPVTITAGGYKETIPTLPTRILCLSASSTQMLYAIGAMHQVVGVDRYSIYPKSAPRTSFTGYETSAEDYLPLHPDLVILAFNESNMVAQLNALHIPVLVMPAASDIHSAYIQLLQLGAATGHSAAAKQEVVKLNRALQHAASEVGNRANGLTYFIELSPSPLYTATSDTFIGSIFSMFKMKDIANAAGHGSNYPEINASYLLKSNPDMVVLADTICCGQSAKTFATRPGYSVLRAVHTHNVYGVNDSVASEWGPHTLIEFANYLAGVLLKRYKTMRPHSFHVQNRVLVHSEKKSNLRLVLAPAYR